MAIKVVVVNEGEENEVGEYESLQSVEVRGATGGTKYNVDPKQDFLIKFVVNGNVITHEAKTKDGKTINVDELPNLTPQDLPSPQIQTGDAGDSSKAVDVNGDPVYPELDADGNPVKSTKKSTKDEEAPKAEQHKVTASR